MGEKVFILNGAAAKELLKIDSQLDEMQSLIDPSSIGYDAQVQMYNQMVDSRNAFLELCACKNNA